MEKQEIEHGQEDQWKSVKGVIQVEEFAPQEEKRPAKTVAQ